MIIRRAPEQTVDLALQKALKRFLATSAPPKYLRDAAGPWLSRHVSSTLPDTLEGEHA